MITRRHAFSLIELLVVIAVIAVLIGILLPALGQARMTARATVCGARLQQIGVGLTAYLNDFPERLPQMKGPLPEGGESVIGALFAGKKGQLPFYAIDEIGAARRPLNGYLSEQAYEDEKTPGSVDLAWARSPSDKGASSTGVPIPGFERTDSMYDLIGCSYTLNDHTLAGEEQATLVPLGGGRMPPVTNTSKTWVIGTHSIYNYQQGGDRGMRWFHPNRVEAGLLFVDMHVRTRVPVPPGVENTTAEYTFLP
ncbi:MAG: type II secretion system protein [Planctomycetota bacterium]|nr:type II secretion system protein [Planctomycetota bacterium]